MSIESLLTPIGQRWLDDAFNMSPSLIPSTVYHYTDAGGLKGMMESGSIWATDYRFLNDKRELLHLRSAVNEMFEDEAESNKSETIRQICTQGAAYGEIQTAYEMFIFSMSDQRDDLSQWRGYAREGMGFTVGFDTVELIKAIDALPFECGFGRVEYDSGKQIDAIRRAMREIDDVVVEAQKKGEQPIDDIIDQAARTLDAIVELRAGISKHESFKGESEWRAAASIPRDDPLNVVKIRSRNDRLIPYLAMPIAGTGKLPITAIGVGPGFVGTEDTTAVRKLCAINGYDPEIYFAATPYRRV